MREVIKSRSQATRERLGGCGFPGCTDFAVCANCVQCAEHHDMQKLVGTCGFDAPVPVKFEPSNPRSEVQMVVVEDNEFADFVLMRRNADA